MKIITNRFNLLLLFALFIAFAIHAENDTETAINITGYEQLKTCLDPNAGFDCYNSVEKIALKKHFNKAKRHKNTLSIQGKFKKIYFTNKGAGDAIEIYRFLSFFTQDIAVVHFEGYETSSFYFVSLATGHVVLNLPPIDGAKSQVSLSPDKKSLIVVTDNSIYDQDSHTTKIEIFELTEDLSKGDEDYQQYYDEYSGVTYNLLPSKLNIKVEEKYHRNRKYKIIWSGNKAVKIQSLAPYKGYMNFYKENNTWAIKENKFLQFLPSVLVLSSEAMESELKFIRPYRWNVRAFYSDTMGLYLFDEKGNVYIGEKNNIKYGGYLVELYQSNNKPLWQGNANIYYNFSPEANNYEGNVFLINLSKFFALSAGKLCPISWVALSVGTTETKYNNSYFDGDCAITTKKKIGKHTSWAYPNAGQDINSNYWTVQYFTDPISPIYDINGECVYYCDAESSED